jgi:hypothetical protein
MDTRHIERPRHQGSNPMETGPWNARGEVTFARLALKRRSLIKLCALSDGLPALGKCLNVHSRHRLVVAGPGRPRPRTHTNSSRSKFDSGEHIRCHGSGSLCTRIHQKGAQRPGRNEEGSLPGIRHASHGSGHYQVDHLIPLELGGPIQSKIFGRSLGRSPA